MNFFFLHHLLRLMIFHAVMHSVDTFFFPEYTITQNSPVFNLNRWYIRGFQLFFWVLKTTFVFCVSSLANLLVRMVHLCFSGQHDTMFPQLISDYWVNFFTEFHILIFGRMRLAQFRSSLSFFFATSLC